MADYLEYDMLMGDIPTQDSPEMGGVFICKTGIRDANTVARWRGAPHEPLGIIYKIEDARKFAEAL